MIEFFRENWEILGVVMTIFGYLLKQTIASRRGLRALLRADLIRLYNKYHDELGYCPIYVKQALEDEYKQYTTLKGNGVGTNIYEALMELPTEPQNKEE